MFFSLIDSYSRRNDINDYGFSPKMSNDIYKILKKYQWFNEVRKWNIKSKLAVVVNIAIPAAFIFFFIFLLKPLVDLKIIYELDKRTNDFKNVYYIYKGMWDVGIDGHVNGISAIITPFILTFIALILLPIGFISQTILLDQKRFKNYFFFEEYQKIYKPNKLFNTANFLKSPLFYMNMIFVIFIEGGCIFLLFVAFDKPYLNVINDPNSYILKYMGSGEPTREWFEVNNTNSLLYVYTYNFKPWTPVIIISVLVIISIAGLFFDSYFFMNHINAFENAKMLKISNIEFLTKQGVTENDIEKIKISLIQSNLLAKY